MRARSFTGILTGPNAWTLGLSAAPGKERCGEHEDDSSSWTHTPDDMPGDWELQAFRRIFSAMHINTRHNYLKWLFGIGIALIAVVRVGPGLAQSGADTETERFIPVEEPRARPEFTLPDLFGGERSMSEWNGNVVLVDFWASWCVPCREEMPAFNALRAEYGDQGFEIIGIAADDLDKVQEFIAQIPIDFPVVYGDVFDMMELSDEFGNYYGGLPFNVFIDRDGMIRYLQKPGAVTFEEAEEILRRLL